MPGPCLWHWNFPGGARVAPIIQAGTDGVVIGQTLLPAHTATAAPTTLLVPTWSSLRPCASKNAATASS